MLFLVAMEDIRKTRHRRTRVVTLVVAMSFVLLCSPVAHGLDPIKAISQYIQTAWNSETGLPQNSVHAGTQTRDGYIWMGTEEGLARFDGAHHSGVCALSEKEAARLTITLPFWRT